MSRIRADECEYLDMEWYGMVWIETAISLYSAVEEREICRSLSVKAGKEPMR